ncbi:MAG: glycine cleavage system protein GcvH [Hyphomicrobium sp.]|jgi:glycine cleavage system H protein
MSCNIPDELRFHTDHLWVKAADNVSEVYIGVSDFAQKRLGTILFVELPRVGETIEAGSAFGTVESHKVVSDLIAPASGEIVEFNEKLRDAANLVNADCYGDGWLVKIRMQDAAHLSMLLTSGDYRALIGD